MCLRFLYPTCINQCFIFGRLNVIFPSHFFSYRFPCTILFHKGGTKCSKTSFHVVKFELFHDRQDFCFFVFFIIIISLSFILSNTFLWNILTIWKKFNEIWSSVIFFYYWQWRDEFQFLNSRIWCPMWSGWVSAECLHSNMGTHGLIVPWYANQVSWRLALPGWIIWVISAMNNMKNNCSIPKCWRSLVFPLVSEISNVL